MLVPALITPQTGDMRQWPPKGVAYRLYLVSVAALVMSLSVSGCGAIARELEDNPVLLKDMPQSLAYIVENPEVFESSEHPLRLVDPGTMLDPPELLEGCWGRFGEEMVQAGAITVAEFIEFDLNTGSVSTDVFWGVNGTAPDCCPRPTIFTEREVLLTVTEGTLVTGPVHSLGFAGVSDEGELVYDRDIMLAAWALLALEEEHEQGTGRFTVDGDFLLIEWGGMGAELFVRSDCEHAHVD